MVDEENMNIIIENKIGTLGDSIDSVYAFLYKIDNKHLIVNDITIEELFLENNSEIDFTIYRGHPYSWSIIQENQQTSIEDYYNTPGNIIDAGKIGGKNGYQIGDNILSQVSFIPLEEDIFNSDPALGGYFMGVIKLESTNISRNIYKLVANLRFLEDPEPEPEPESKFESEPKPDTFIIEVTAENGNYILSGTDSSGSFTDHRNKDIVINLGDQIVFNMDTVGHPFWIKNTRSTGTKDHLKFPIVINNGSESNVEILFDPIEPGVYYYNCEYHSTMNGKITVDTAIVVFEPEPEPYPEPESSPEPENPESEPEPEPEPEIPDYQTNLNLIPTQLVVDDENMNIVIENEIGGNKDRYDLVYAFLFKKDGKSLIVNDIIVEELNLVNNSVINYTIYKGFPTEWQSKNFTHDVSDFYTTPENIIESGTLGGNDGVQIGSSILTSQSFIPSMEEIDNYPLLNGYFMGVIKFESIERNRYKLVANLELLNKSEPEPEPEPEEEVPDYTTSLSAIPTNLIIFNDKIIIENNLDASGGDSIDLSSIPLGTDVNGQIIITRIDVIALSFENPNDYIEFRVYEGYPSVWQTNNSVANASDFYHDTIGSPILSSGILGNGNLTVGDNIIDGISQLPTTAYLSNPDNALLFSFYHPGTFYFKSTGGGKIHYKLECTIGHV